MTHTEIKQEAQDKLMQWLANGVLAASEDEEAPEIIEEMKRQAKRIGKKFGYVSWPGLFVASVD